MTDPGGTLQIRVRTTIKQLFTQMNSLETKPDALPRNLLTQIYQIEETTKRK